MNKTPTAGIIRVVFDAGGPGSSVDSNPQQLEILDEDTLRIEWHLEEKCNTFADYAVEFGNVVLCHHDDRPAGYDFDSTPVLDEHGYATIWRWTLTRVDREAPPVQALSGEIGYEIFFSYCMKPRGSGKRHTVGLRHTYQVDPSLILPSRSSSGGPVPDQGGKGRAVGKG